VRPDPQDLLTRWLDAEGDSPADAGDAADAADTALLALFEAVPLASPAPAPGFADRVMRRVQLEAGSAAGSEIPAVVPSWREQLLRSRGFRLVLAGSLAAAGLTLPWLPWILAVLARIWSFGDVIRLTANPVVEASHVLVLLAGIGKWAFTVGDALALSATTPAIFKLVTVCLVISGASFLFLRDLITRDRRWSYADHI